MDDSGSRRWVVIGACILAAMLLALWVMPDRRGHPVSVQMTLLQAVALVALVGTLAGLVARFAGEGLAVCEYDQLKELAWRCGLIGAWCMPVAILADRRKGVVLLAAAVLGWIIARAWLEEEEAGPRLVWRTTAPAAAAGELALIALLAQSYGWTAILAAVAVVLIAPRRTVEGRRWMPALQATGAVAVAFFALLRIIGPWQVHQVAAASPDDDGLRDSHYNEPNMVSGAILLSPSRPKTTVFVPPRILARGTAVRRAPLEEIPFTGVYWMLPDRIGKPSKRALVLRETPLDYNFSAPARQALSMSAHQELPTPLATSCCSAIEVRARSAERDASQVLIGLVLENTGEPRTRRERLPMQRLPAGSDVTLRFAMPAAAPFESFDRLGVEFLVKGPRSRSANVSIEGFRLVGR